MSKLIEDVWKLKGRSQASKSSADRGKMRSGEQDYREAKVLLEKAIAMLQRELERLQCKSVKDRELEVHSILDLATELADCYGMLGGICRREGDLDEAIKIYDIGRQYEEGPYGLENSYNMTNAIAVRVLKDPKNLSSQRDLMDGAIKALEWQVTKGGRKNQWWAWADLGELYLLSNKGDEASTAYEHFRRCGPRAINYESTISVLRELEENVRESDPSISLGIAEAVKGLIKNKPVR